MLINLVQSHKYYFNNNSILQYWFYKNLGDKLTKVELGFVNWAQNFNAGFVKPTLYTIWSRIFCLMFLIDAIKANVEKKLKNSRERIK